MTLSDLTQTVQTQITGTGSGNFNVQGVQSVVCNPPDRWNAGKTFECFVYNTSNTDLGFYEATVLPDDSSGNAQWNGSWIPAGG
jgi:hypothetical protein